jgi:prepilin-type N-terminal cleavage/methylation domain-containing protein
MKFKAFTLIELIVVLVILGILAALAIPTFAALKAGAAQSTALRSGESLAREANALAALASTSTTVANITAAAADLTVDVPHTLSGTTDGVTITISAGGSLGCATVLISGTQAVAASATATGAPLACPTGT